MAKQAKVRTSPTTSETRPTTIALAPKSTGRRGVAASVDRMVPLLYSAVMANTPSTPMVSEPRARPVREWLVGSKPIDGPWRCTLLVASTVTPRLPKTVARSVQVVERSERSLNHSARTT